MRTSNCIRASTLKLFLITKFLYATSVLLVESWYGLACKSAGTRQVGTRGGEREKKGRGGKREGDKNGHPWGERSIFN